MHNLGCSQIHDFKTSSQEAVGPMQLELDDIWASLDGSRFISNPLHQEDGHTQCIKRKIIWGYF